MNGEWPATDFNEPGRCETCGYNPNDEDEREQAIRADERDLIAKALERRAELKMAGIENSPPVSWTELSRELACVETFREVAKDIRTGWPE